MSYVSYMAKLNNKSFIQKWYQEKGDSEASPI